MKTFLFASFAAAAFCQTPSRLTDVRQLTHGGQNAEAYWSPDGKRLIFQTTRSPYDCDQIFVMNADGSDQHLVSTGKGRTTCAYFLADNKHIVYASTHLVADACPTNPDRSKGYLWGVFSGYDIFLATDSGTIEKRLTDTPGYDAEATVNWKTGNIIYTSLASHDLDLWTMHPDGSAKKQLTKTTGYDGGPGTECVANNVQPRPANVEIHLVPAMQHSSGREVYDQAASGEEDHPVAPDRGR